jgi:Flp pilus assembly protein TadG
MIARKNVEFQSTKRRENTHRSQQRGTSLLEYALVLIVVLMFIFGIIDFGRALYAYHFVANAAREATRYAIVRSSTCASVTNPVPNCPATQTTITNLVTNMATGIGLNNANSIEANFTGQNPPSSTNPACTTGTPPVPLGCTAQVTVNYPFKFILPFMPMSTTNCTASSIPASICMTSTSAMVVTQ